jgi:hypothetical protein
MNRFSFPILLSVALSTAQPLDRIYKIFHDIHVNHEESCKSCLNITPQSDALLIEVLRVANQVDARPFERILYLPRKN